MSQLRSLNTLISGRSPLSVSTVDLGARASQLAHWTRPHPENLLSLNLEPGRATPSIQGTDQVHASSPASRPGVEVTPSRRGTGLMMCSTSAGGQQTTSLLRSRAPGVVFRDARQPSR